MESPRSFHIFLPTWNYHKTSFPQKFHGVFHTEFHRLSTEKLDMFWLHETPRSIKLGSPKVFKGSTHKPGFYPYIMSLITGA